MIEVVGDTKNFNKKVDGVETHLGKLKNIAMVGGAALASSIAVGGAALFKWVNSLTIWRTPSSKGQVPQEINLNL